MQHPQRHMTGERTVPQRICLLVNVANKDHPIAKISSAVRVKQDKFITREARDCSKSLSFMAHETTKYIKVTCHA